MRMANRMSILLFSGTKDKLTSVATLSTGAVAMGMDVDIFLAYWGMNAFRKAMTGSNNRFDRDFEDMSGTLAKNMQAKNINWLENLRKAKANGNVKIHVCSTVADLFEAKKEDFDPIVDDVIGIGGYIEQAKDAAITLYI
jgi:peroxiredoxin family protein